MNAVPSSRIANFPVTFFTIVMGLSGFTLALRAVEAAMDLTGLLSSVVQIFTVLVFVMVSLIYIAKAAGQFEAVKAEWRHPVKLAFFPAISISLMLLSVTFLPVSEGLARAVWLIGASLQIVLAISVISGWIGTRSFQHGHLNPAWFIPAVGNVIAPIAGVQLGYVEVSWFFMSVGLIMWFTLLSLVMNRLIFHDPLPERLQPTLVILIAPPAVAYLGWGQLTGEAGAFGRILLNAAYLFTLLVFVQAPRLLRLPFSLSFWALSFPVAGVTIASLRHADATGSTAHLMIGLALFALLCGIIAVLIIRTLGAVKSGAAFEPG